MKIEITFLGTSDAIPTSSRNHSAVLLNHETETILFDCGEGTQRQFRILKLNPCKLTKIILTHLHGDHSLGLPGLLKTLDMMSYAKTLRIYGPRGLKEHFFHLQKLYGRFGIKHELHEIHSTSIPIINEKNFQIIASPMSHNIETFAYAFIIKEKTRIRKDKLKKLKLPNSPLLKQLQQGKNIIFKGRKIKAKDLTYKQESKKVSIVLDTAMNNNIIPLVKDSDILICESTYSSEDEQRARDYKHLTTKQAADIAKKANVKELILTHISHRYQHIAKKLEAEARKTFKNAKLAKDFDKIIL